MRIGVIGAGAVGGVIAALLSDGGHEVEVTARGEHLAAIRSGGLTATGAWGEHRTRPAAGERLRTAPEIAFVCVKAQDARGALTEHRDLLDGCIVVIVQNGLVGLAEAARLLPRSRCVGALALYAASLVGPGRVSVTAAGGTWIGADAGAPPPEARRVAETLSAVMPARATANFTGCQWTKLIVNQVNAMPAITGLSAQQTIAHPGLRRVITAGMREAVRVGLASGVRFGSLQGLNSTILRVFAHAPLAAAAMLPRAMAKRMGERPNPGSTLQSVRRGRRTEIDYLNGAVVEAATALGRAAPVNSALVELVHEVEASGRFLGPDRVLARISPCISL